ncbi:carbohydrate esterase family 16 protein [Daedalea quercina L-15889]|uniref:Carbohydrate esterase family 16 protein n=1 Tax=Daedalea quercina L-15889 TaxID=1314783 RepID=A0A165TYM5_9APHY|nr:carbohydrate esterase family 16 protein [Daedalea quercina L-15889]
MGNYDCIHLIHADNDVLVKMLLEDVKHLYENGARNFLIIDVLPLDCAPVLASDNYLDKQARYIELWNERLWEGASRFAEECPETSVFVFSADEMMLELLRDVEAYGFAEGDEWKPDGKIWINSHFMVGISKHIHRLLAEKIALAVSLVEEESA